MLILGLLQNPLYFVAFIAALIVGITVHEFAHAWTANRCGDPTARIEGRLTLNPFAHLDPLGTLFIFLVGFGWGRPVPINPIYFRHKSDELKVAFAGIVTNILVALILAIPIRIALMNGVHIDSSPFLSFLDIMVELNIILAAFNLLPVPPLDGSHLVEYFLKDQARQAYNQFGPYLLIGLVLLDRISSTSILMSIMEPIIRFLSFLVSGSPTSIL